ncbi:MAG: phosphate transport system regulatory protein PhoU [Dictyoglomus sp. NZ13-RE01]|nr:MAG: phosphate transport system regulatory protein PhoU [Dictyoglomus sp. NZ13-RE01]
MNSYNRKEQSSVDIEKEIMEIREDVGRMSSIVEKMLHQILESLRKRNLDLALDVIQKDDLVDKLYWDIENKCIKILSEYKPNSQNLRVIASTMKIIKDIERIGDYSVDIAKFSSNLLKNFFELPWKDVFILGELSEYMLKEITRIYLNSDLKAIENLALKYKEINQKYQDILNNMMEHIQKNPKITQQIIQLIMISRYLERISDHITNMIEIIYYMETGEKKELHG